MSIVFLTTSLPDASVGVFYSQPIRVTGGKGVCTFFVTSGILPPGLSLSGTPASAGSAVSSISTDQLVASQVTLSGTPTLIGHYTFTITAVDTKGNSTSQVFTINVGVILEAFDEAVVRLTKDGTVNLWQVFSPAGQTQTGGLSTTNQDWEQTVTGVGGGASNGYYMHFFPNGNVSGYSFGNGGFMQEYMEYGSWNISLNRMRWKVIANANIARRADGGDVYQVGMYQKHHGDPDNTFQGNHYYCAYDMNLYSGEPCWMYLDMQPAHQVTQPSSLNFPYDPENHNVLVDQNYIAGTCTVSNGSPTVTGTNGNFNAAFSSNNFIHFSQDGAVTCYRIKSISADGITITLGIPAGASQNYLGVTNSGIQVKYVVPLPSVYSGDQLATYQTAADYRPTIGFFDALTRFYQDGSPFGGSTNLNVTYRYGAGSVTLEAVDNTTEPIVSIQGTGDGTARLMHVCCSPTVTYNPSAGKFEVCFQGPANSAASYKIAYKTSSMKAVGGGISGWNSGTWDNTTVSNPNSDFKGTIWTSPALAKQTMYFGILPVDNGTTLPNPNGYFTEILYTP